MQTIHITLDESLLAEVDQIVDECYATRSEFIQEALKLAIQSYRSTVRAPQRQRATNGQRTAVIHEWSDTQLWGDV